MAQGKAFRGRYGAILPTSKPDVDNILKAAMDGLEGAVYHSDAQVTSVTAKKCFVTQKKRSSALYGSFWDNTRPRPVFFTP